MYLQNYMAGNSHWSDGCTHSVLVCCLRLCMFSVRCLDKSQLMKKIKITIVVMYSNDIFKSSDLFRYSNFEQQNETTCSTCYTKINLTYYNDHQEISHKINVSFLKCSISVIKLSFMINRISYTVRLNSCI